MASHKDTLLHLRKKKQYKNTVALELICVLQYFYEKSICQNIYSQSERWLSVSDKSHRFLTHVQNSEYNSLQICTKISCMPLWTKFKSVFFSVQPVYVSKAIASGVRKKWGAPGQAFFFFFNKRPKNYWGHNLYEFITYSKSTLILKVQG